MTRLRESVRALVLDERGRVLLVRLHWRGPETSATFWVTPGGGVEVGESRLETLRRELREETGLVIDRLGPEVWTKTALFPMTGWDGQVDHVHLVRVPHFEPVPALSDSDRRREGIEEVRWWSVDEIARSSDTFAPRSLADLLQRLRSEGVPSAPFRLTGL